MDDASIQGLLNDLKQDDQAIRDRATQELWQIWFQQKGVVGLELLCRSQALCQAGLFDEARTLLDELIEHQPDFAEAWNQRAIFYYQLQQYRRSLTDCQRVVELNPNHFGAWHGMGLCHAALGEYVQAIQAFRRALEIQPYAVENQRLILECTARLS